MALYLDFMPPSTLIKILRSSSSCVRTLDTAGWRDLPGDLLISAMQARGTVDTGLEKLDLQGCREIGPHELWWLIRHSPRLKWLSLRGLNRVYPEHIHALASCPLLEYLDLAFCKNLPVKCVALLTSMDRPSMRELRISGFEGSKELFLIATRMPNLQTLDMAYCPDLTDENIKHLVSPSSEEWVPELAKMNAARCRRDSVFRDVRIAFLTAGQAGQAAAEFTGCNGLVPRRILKLRKLVLSQCSRLTDQSCQYLAHAVPALEIFEMASADGNSNLQTAGLVDLFKTCPAIRKIDLEGALDIDDDFLSTVTPRPSDESSNAVGSRLETVCLGFAGNVTAGAMLDMIRQCSRLKHLDIDVSTHFARQRWRPVPLTSPSLRTRRHPTSWSKSLYANGAVPPCSRWWTAAVSLAMSSRHWRVERDLVTVGGDGKRLLCVTRTGPGSTAARTNVPTHPSFRASGRGTGYHEPIDPYRCLSIETGSVPPFTTPSISLIPRTAVLSCETGPSDVRGPRYGLQCIEQDCIEGAGLVRCIRNM